MRDAVRNQFVDFTTRFEGYVPFMYLDVKGLVTTGIGNLIDSVGAAQALPWRHKSSGSLATPSEVASAWNAVKARQDMKSKGGMAFSGVTDLILDDAGIHQLVTNKVLQNEQTLKQYFPAFDAYPADAQLGLLSMAWALGPEFARKYPKFSAAINQLVPDFNAAASESHINETGNPGVRPRNEANVTLFENAAAALSQGWDFDLLHWPFDALMSSPTAQAVVKTAVQAKQVAGDVGTAAVQTVNEHKVLTGALFGLSLTSLYFAFRKG